ncbi:hypothetical protein [Chitinophaga tropicalis]|uniref:Lipocalin-like domain-containing protein n=1 Tax=Chitinophaga tropicalis TaxID=2683588 RepID=A0A7K1U0B1_9BACT|nr:hypothetical protein [Chitinophaga tropicalis]MVT07807.1 hypothetical protein [Chitinophaga tropicalis]
MKYPILLITVILSLSQFHLSGQILKQLPGKWSINNVLMKPEMDTVSQTAMAFLAGKNSFKQFTANNRFIEFEKDSYTYGDWLLKGNKLLLLRDEGSIISYEITRASTDTLSLSIGSYIFSYVNTRDSLAADKKPAVNKKPLVKANKSQLAKKWFFSKTIDLSGGPENRSGIGNLLFKKSWYEFRNDGTCTRRFTKPVQGTWELTDNGKRLLIIDDNGVGQFWDIAGISGKELILQMPNGQIQRVYSTEETL